MRYVALLAALLLLSGCAAARRHPTVTKLVFIGLGAAIGATVAIQTEKECDHYEYGQVGTGVPCPKDRDKK